MKDLNELGIQEMKVVEMKETQGGSIIGGILVVFGLMGGTAYIVDNWDRAVEGWNDGKNAAG